MSGPGTDAEKATDGWLCAWSDPGPLRPGETSRAIDSSETSATGPWLDTQQSGMRGGLSVGKESCVLGGRQLWPWRDYLSIRRRISWPVERQRCSRWRGQLRPADRRRGDGFCAASDERKGRRLRLPEDAIEMWGYTPTMQDALDEIPILSSRR